MHSLSLYEQNMVATRAAPFASSEEKPLAAYTGGRQLQGPDRARASQAILPTPLGRKGFISGGHGQTQTVKQS